MKILEMTPTQIKFGIAFIGASVLGYAGLYKAAEAVNWDDKLPVSRDTVEEMMKPHEERLNQFAVNITRSQEQQNNFWVKAKRQEQRELQKIITEQEQTSGRGNAPDLYYEQMQQLSDEIRNLIDENKDLAK